MKTTKSKYPNAPYTDILYYNYTVARTAWIIGTRGKNIRDCVTQTQQQERGCGMIVFGPRWLLGTYTPLREQREC